MRRKTEDFVMHRARPERGVGKVTKVNSLELEVFFVDRVESQLDPTKTLASFEFAEVPMLSKAHVKALGGVAACRFSLHMRRRPILSN